MSCARVASHTMQVPQLFQVLPYSYNAFKARIEAGRSDCEQMVVSASRDHRNDPTKLTSLKLI